MANQFLVEIHNFITARMDLIREVREQARSRADRAMLKHCDGRLEELQTLRRFLSDRFNLDTQTYY